jgi:hypothetical protein
MDDSQSRKMLSRLVALLGSTSVALLVILVFVLARERSVVSSAATPAIGKLRTDYDPSFDIFTPVPDPGIDSVYMPGLRDAPAWSTRVPLTTNSAGLRYPEEIRPKPTGTYRILVVGDSFVAAHAAPYEEGVAPKLEALLERTAHKESMGIQRFEVIPVAVSGWNVFAEIRFVLHNLHVLQPDLVVHALNSNDVDGGSGFVEGTRKSSVYDCQGLFGRSNTTVAAPRNVLRNDSPIKSLLASYLIPESVSRWEQAASEAEWLKTRLEEDYHATYVVHCIDPHVLYAVERAFLRFQPAERILARAPWGVKDTLAPLDKHPNGNGYSRWARALADYLDRAGILSIDREELARSGTIDVCASMAEVRRTEAQARADWEVDRIPAGFRVTADEIVPEDGVRCIVGGVYARCVLSTRSLFVLRRAPGEDVLTLEVAFPAVSALVDRKLTLWIDGASVQKIAMQGTPSIRVPLSEASRSRDLVEVVLEADGFYTDLAQAFVGGVYAAAPQAGRLVSIGLVTE